MLKWSGLKWDEGPGSVSISENGNEGPYGPYI